MSSKNMYLDGSGNSGSIHESQLLINSQSQQGVNYISSNQNSESKSKSKSNSSSVLLSFSKLSGDTFDKELKQSIKQQYFSNNKKLSDYLSNKNIDEGVKLLDECSKLFFKCINEYCQKKFTKLNIKPIKEETLHGDLWMDFTVRELFMYQQQDNNLSFGVPSVPSFLDRKCIDVFRNEYMQVILEKLKEINKE